MEAAQAEQTAEQRRWLTCAFMPAAGSWMPRLAALVAAAGGSNPLQAQTIGSSAPVALQSSWIWLSLVALLLVMATLLAAVCLLLLRRDQALHGEIERLRSAAASASAPASEPAPPPAVEAPVAAPDPVRTQSNDSTTSEQEHESFTYTVSHDLRAPIRVVEGFTRILKEDYGRVLDRIGNDHLDRVLGAAARMNSMIDSLLALSQLSSRPLARQPVDLSQLAQFVADDLRRQSPERTVELRIDPDMQVIGDPTLLRVVVENLLGNAWKYTGRCARAEISFCWHQTQPQTFTVADNGAGFDMRFSDRLFGVFQRLHSATDYQGTGVGLASVRRIIRRHGGEIWAEAEIDRGARFHFSIRSP
jgi:signal transduction histidine kinase